MISSHSSCCKPKWLQLDGSRIHCLTAGESGSALVLLHGGSIDSASLSWQLVIPSLARRFRVFAPDLPGHGLSDRPDMPYSLDYFVDQLGQIADSLGLEKFALAGLSMGGMISSLYARRNSSRISRLVLVDSAGMGEPVPWGWLLFPLGRITPLHLLVRKGMAQSRRLVRFGLGRIVANDFFLTSELLDEVMEEARRPQAGRAWQRFVQNELCWNGFRHNPVTELTSQPFPVLILHGHEDLLIPVGQARKAARYIPDSKLVILEKCGHWLPREKPHRFVEEVEVFSNQL